MDPETDPGAGDRDSRGCDGHRRTRRGPGTKARRIPFPSRYRGKKPGTAVRKRKKPTGGCPLPVPVSPPTILRPEVQPIDLDTALRLAGVQNPELNVARQRVLEAVAVRQLAAARFLPSINPGMNYDTHSGNLQQSNGNILSVNRSAVYVGAGATRWPREPSTSRESSSVATRPW